MDHPSPMGMAMQQHPQHMMGPMHPMQMMQMPDMGVNGMPPQPQLDVKPAAPAKKRKKAASRAQQAPPPQQPPPLMKQNLPGPPGMDHGLMMAREHSNTIIAKNPFDDFPDSCSMQPPPGMGPQGQQFMPGMQGPNSYGPPPGQMGYPPGPPQNHPMMMGNGQNMPRLPPNSMHMQMQHSQHPGLPMVRQGMLDSSDSRIYPMDRCMITNPQNPNAPPVYPCGLCHREVPENGPAIFCEGGCNFWYHRNCTGLSELAHKLLSAEVYAEWACDNCNRDISLIKIKP